VKAGNWDGIGLERRGAWGWAMVWGWGDGLSGWECCFKGRLEGIWKGLCM